MSVVAMQAPLPEGWAVYKDAEGNEYYANASTGETSWEAPTSGGDTSAEASHISDEQLVDLVDRITDEGFLSFVNDFVEENAHYFVDGEEHRHYYHEIHSKYKRFFESRVESWLRVVGTSVEAFAVAASQRDGLASDVSQELLAVSDYVAFVEMMRNRKVSLERNQGDPGAAG
eukprot:TRINITY_DN46129_c0_g1_i1.p1 TRINITY_DN46129_c0_g1~~TRINITY_DN46129_c0_g1_i1.p1  ORF type:complete len:199 (+),score=37.17 TRINITY_DN46129_c0_g1_i1:79-597(+)